MAEVSTNYYVKLHIGKARSMGNGEIEFIYDTSALSLDAISSMIMGSEDLFFEDECGRLMSTSEMAQVILGAKLRTVSPESFS